MRCEKLDDIFLKYHKLVDADEKNDFSYRIKIEKRNRFVAYDSMMLQVWISGDVVFDASVIKKSRFVQINEGLIQKAMSPARLMRYLELGGGVELEEVSILMKRRY